MFNNSSTGEGLIENCPIFVEGNDPKEKGCGNRSLPAKISGKLESAIGFAAAVCWFSSALFPIKVLANFQKCSPSFKWDQSPSQKWDSSLMRATKNWCIVRLSPTAVDTAVETATADHFPEETQNHRVGSQN
jgi:hypothetical protein